jgi:hypothetical protein
MMYIKNILAVFTALAVMVGLGAFRLESASAVAPATVASAVVPATSLHKPSS